jgi:putative acetyltransferase
MTERPYQPSDVSGIIETYTASIHTLGAPYYTQEQLAAWAPAHQDEARWAERLKELHTIVADADGFVAGFVSYTDIGYLDFLFTHPTFARRGVATRLYQRAEAALIALRVPTITTHASLAARAFFDRHGFVVDAEELVECRGAYLRRFAMHKHIIDSRTVL